MSIDRFVDGIIRFRWWAALLIPLITLALASQLRYLQFEGSYRIWFGEDSPILKQYDTFRSVFGNDDALLIMFRDDEGVFNPKALGVVKRITEALWQTTDIARVDSLTNYQYVHSDPAYPDDVIVEDFIDDPAALSPEQLADKARIAAGEEMIVGRIVSADMKTTMIAARLTPKAGDDPEVSARLKAAGEAIVAKEAASGYTFHLGGGPILNMAFITLGEHDVKTFTPFVLLIAMVLLWFIFRRPSGMLLSLSVVIFTFLIVLAVQVLLGYRLNNFTANLPVFVVAIGIADAMHLFWIYLVGRRRGMGNHDAIRFSVRKNFLPTLLTSLTTAVGFASLAVSQVIPVKTLGIATATAALLAFVLTILFVPAMLAILNPKVARSEEEESESHDALSLRSARFIIRHDRRILLGSLLLFTLIGIGIAWVKVDSNTVRYFKEHVPFRETVTFVQRNLTGPMAYEIVVDSGEKDGIKSPEFMRTVARFTEAFKAQYPAVRHTTSLVDVVEKFNDVMTGSPTVPDGRNLIAQYLLLYSLSLPQGMEINDRMDVDERQLRVTASVDIVDTSLDLEMMQWVEDWWAQTPYRAQVNGQTEMFAHMQHDVTDTLVESILLAIAAVSLMMMLIFRNLRMIPLFIIPNVLPIALVVGVMGWLGITIDLGVAVSGAIIIGVAVDDTIHFLVKYREARREGESFEAALAYVYHYAGKAIVFTTLILSAAFMIFALSDFVPNVNFGIVTASALVIAVVIDLLMLPAWLSLADSGKRSLIA
ncbi:MMPL family transporter [Sulfurimonas sp. HSL-3221]|uniref:efflux RND transporter permease subunit n=1 Tax=Sulfurimonadaceae TaxID=2771471 RepID=UPI001E368C02|nr:MMPL family transporter [Sulfurimonas sp. HSL-3221]UFS62804.1 MMPL family transporter [Sulfurimonas sp. HSL-3221]